MVLPSANGLLLGCVELELEKRCVDFQALAEQGDLLGDLLRRCVEDLLGSLLQIRLVDPASDDGLLAIEVSGEREQVVPVDNLIRKADMRALNCKADGDQAGESVMRLSESPAEAASYLD